MDLKYCLSRHRLHRQSGTALMSSEQLLFDFSIQDTTRPDAPTAVPEQEPLQEELRSFNEFGKETIVTSTETETETGKTLGVATFVNEFWTSRQRAAHSLHEISYRACFKPQLPRFFIERLTAPGEVVYDPFAGRGTTLLEAALMGRIPMGCDINPLSGILTLPRLNPPLLDSVSERLSAIKLDASDEFPEELLVFYHPDTLRQICSLKEYLIKKNEDGTLDDVDSWIRLVAINRLSGHSAGFFSVYTLPPNQAVAVESQRKINEKRYQAPPLRDVKKCILKKSRSLLKDCDEQTRAILNSVADKAVLLTQSAGAVSRIPSSSVALAVTSPPFLDVVNYAQDNWLRCWFCGIDPKTVPITILKKIEDWQDAMSEVFIELERILKPGGHLAFEVGEVRHGKVKLEEAVIPCGLKAGLEPSSVLINDQQFTKTANVWGVNNGQKGTNTNRIVVFKKNV